MSGVADARTGRETVTNPESEDPRLRGRTYGIPFARVWDEAVALAAAGLPGWTLLASDDIAGVIRAEKVSNFIVTKRISDVRVEIGLDENGQTRVDLSAATREDKGDLGSNARAVDAFVRALDQRLQRV